MAECRILEDQVANPMLPGDKIYTPLWHPGRQEHFALSGFMDVDGNGTSDWQLVQDLVRASGGVIDSELTPSGDIKGEMDPAVTRYLVTGTTPKEHADKHAQMISMASKKGIQTMPLDTFLDHIGFAGVSKVVELGPYADPSNFNTPRKERPPLKKPQFRSRRPPAGANGAYGGSAK